MNRKYIIISLLILVFMAQWFVPVKMISNQEDVLETGTPFKFRTQPVDPNDPFRGKYVNLYFLGENFPVENSENWNAGEKVYLEISEDRQGFARIKSVSREKPDTKNYLYLPISYFYNYNSHELTFDFPFNRFYLEETKAKPAENIYRESVIDTNDVAYALVWIKNGDFVLEDVFINDTSIVDLVDIANNNF